MTFPGFPDKWQVTLRIALRFHEELYTSFK